MTLADDLRAAKALIDTPEKWCQGIARPRLCAIYAVAEVCFDRGYGSRTGAASDALRKALPRGAIKAAGGAHPVVHFNDTHAHADIMALFDRAIAKAESSQ